MGDMNVVMIVLLVVLVAIQAWAVYAQRKHIREVGDELRTYGKIITGTHKTIMGRGCVVAMAVKGKTVKRAKFVSGMGTFKRFRNFPEAEGKKIEDIRAEFINPYLTKKGKNQFRAIALENALNMYYEK